MDRSIMKDLIRWKNKANRKPLILQGDYVKIGLNVPYETKDGTKRVRPVKIADCKRGEASDIVFQRTKFNWKSTIRQRLNAGVCELLMGSRIHGDV